MRRLGIFLALAAAPIGGVPLVACTAFGTSGTAATFGPDAAFEADADANATTDAAIATAPDAAPADPYAAAVLADGPVAYWRLDDPSGATLHDEMGLRDLTLDPLHVVFQETGAVHGHAIKLDGDAILTMTGTTFDLSSGKPFTIEAWIRPTDLSANTRSVFAKLTTVATGPDSGSYLWVNGGSSKLGFERYDDKSLTDYVDDNNYIPTPAGDRFNYVVVVVDGGPGGPQLYIDGVLFTRQLGVLTGPIADPSAPVTWGDKFIGGLDELAFYDKALDLGTVQAHLGASRLSPP